MRHSRNPDALGSAMKEGDGKGNVHAPFTRKVGVEIYSRLTEWLRTGLVVVRSLVLFGERDVQADCVSQPNPIEVVPGGLTGIPAGLERLKNGAVSGVEAGRSSTGHGLILRIVFAGARTTEFG